MKIARTKHGHFLRTDEREDVIASLEICVDCLKRVEQNLTRWKWAIISLHNALQGAMVCHLSGTAEVGALRKDSAKKWLDVLQANDDPVEFPKTRLAEFNELLKRLADGSRMIERAGNSIEINSSEERSAKKLNGLRNDFVHFSPKGWSIELSGMKTIISDVGAIILRICDDPWPFRHLSKTRKKYLARKVGRLVRQAQQLN